MAPRLVRALVVATLLAGLVPVTLPIPRAQAADAPNGGGLVVRTVDVAGAALIGTCLELYVPAPDGSRGKLVVDSAQCDQPTSTRAQPRGTPDGFADGTIAWTGLEPGKYVVHETFPAALAGTIATYEVPADVIANVPANAVGAQTVRHRLTGGLTLRITDGANRAVTGACFSVIFQDPRTPRTTTRCDGSAAVGAAATSDGLADGYLLFVGLTPTGTATPYLLKQALTPAGREPAADQRFTADPAAPTDVTVANTTGTGGGLAVSTVDPTGTTLIGGCLQLWRDPGGGAALKLVDGVARCDQPGATPTSRGVPDGSADGQIGWAALVAGDYVLRETFAVALPAGSATYELAPESRVTVGNGVLTSTVLVHRPTAGLTLHVVDARGAPLAGACFVVKTRAGLVTRSFSRCDGSTSSVTGAAGDGAADGLVVFTGLAPTGGATTYTLHEDRTPPGYLTVADQQVVADPLTPTELTIQHATGKGGGLAARAVDIAGTALIGACYELWTDAGKGKRGALVPGSARCDLPTGSKIARGTPDGELDTFVGWPNLLAGAYVIHETLGPALANSTARYELAADKGFNVRADAVTSIDLAHRLVGGLTIRKTDASGRPLPGACFSVSTPDRTQRPMQLCDTTTPPATGVSADGVPDGILLFAGLTPTLSPTQYRVAETLPPPGYVAVADQTVTIDPAMPTEITVVDRTGAGGGGGSGTVVTSMTLEIDSTIEIRTLNAMPVAQGITHTIGRVEIVGPPGGSWSGTGTLESTTKSGPAAGCPSIAVSGTGTYDWIVRGAHIGPELDPSALSIDMDSGPINESPDAFEDGCAALTGTMNTWENLFFQVYRAKYQGAGFHVDGWKVLDDGTAWTTGGAIAEAHWTGSCPLPVVIDCSDTTTFRLSVAVGPGPGPTPGPTTPPGGPVGSEQPVATEQPIDLSPVPAVTASPGPDGGIVDCGRDCGGLSLGALLPFVIGGGVLILGAGFLFLRIMGSNQVVKVEGPTLGGQGGTDPAMDPLDVQVDRPIDQKVAPIDPTLAIHDEKIAPAPADWKIDPSIAIHDEKIMPIDPNVAIYDGTIKLPPAPGPLPGDPIQPLDPDLPPPPQA